VLPAFLLGLALARTMQRNQQQSQRLRVVAFAMLTPFFFLRSGMNVSLGAVWANLGLLGPPATIPPELATRLAMEEDNPT
jgi:Kef-type K+ transport system membrane component KefB